MSPRLPIKLTLKMLDAKIDTKAGERGAEIICTRYCIDKCNLEELPNVINSMFHWYRGANKCYVLLSDVTIATEEMNLDQTMSKESFLNSRWVTKGWTLK